ncbi:hypothetical protein PoMZ_08855 [Pyricularia oryzae]|uniref:Uncharacterized protein n=1 Tax=Pyricularia oryzae TaxID=318829 RepID=A0A4P7NIP9_PYROR|nr:hypothetical protein PoMZ_08855 [Pyricularia oryzae]
MRLLTILSFSALASIGMAAPGAGLPFSSLASRGVAAPGAAGGNTLLFRSSP